MAKELPYFKFEPSQWDTGNIQMCSQESKGVFIDLCSIYWQRLGELPYKLALQKVCGGNATALTSLCNEGVIKVIEDMICIDFLNEQLVEFENTSLVNSKNARDGWEKRRKNATALQPQSERNAIREEKRRQDKKREEKMKGDEIIEEKVKEEKVEVEKTELEKAFDEWVAMRKKMKDGITERAIELGKSELRKLSGGIEQTAIEIINQSILNSWKGFFPLKQQHGTSKKGQPQIDGIMELADKVSRGEISGNVFGGY